VDAEIVEQNHNNIRFPIIARHVLICGRMEKGWQLSGGDSAGEQRTPGQIRWFHDEF
jgi:hypothetical protein